jgi:hypothetical protein
MIAAEEPPLEEDSGRQVQHQELGPLYTTPKSTSVFTSSEQDESNVIPTRQRNPKVSK